MPEYTYTDTETGQSFDIMADDPAHLQRIVSSIKSNLTNQKPRGILGTATDAARMLASGASMEFADELSAGANAALGRGDYETNLREERLEDERILQRSPIAGNALKIGGAIVSPVTKLFGAAGQAAKLPKYGEFMATGAGLGGLTGAGASEEGNRLAGGLVGGGFGAALGTAIPGLMQGGAAVARGVADRFSAPATAAARKLYRAFDRDGITPDWAKRRLAELGDDSVLADLGGNVRGLAESAATVPGKALTAAEGLEARQWAQGDRVMDGTLKILGVDSLESMVKARSAAARPWYEKAFSMDVYRPIKNATIDRLMTRPNFQKGLRAGIADVLDEAAITGDKSVRAFNTYFEGQSLNDPNLVLKTAPTLRILDAAKRGIDKMLNSGGDEFVNPQTGKLTQSGVRLKQMRDALMDAIDESTAGTPEGVAYKTARQMWGGPSDTISALSHIQKAVDKSAFGADVTKRVFGNREKRQLLKDLFKDDDTYKEFENLISNEKTMFDTYSDVLGNSRTAFRKAAQDDMGSDLVDRAFNVAQNPSMGNTSNQLFSGIRDWMRKPSTGVADELAPLFSSDKAVQAQQLEALLNRISGGRLIDQITKKAAPRVLSGTNKLMGYSSGLLGGG
jgi:hypothetical protein